MTGQSSTSSGPIAQMRERLNKVLQVSGKLSFGAAIEAEDWYRNGDIFSDLAALLDVAEAAQEMVHGCWEGPGGDRDYNDSALWKLEDVLKKLPQCCAGEEL